MSDESRGERTEPAGGAAPGLSTDVAESVKLVTVLSRAYQAVHRHSRAHAQRHGLSPGEFGVLEALLHKGPLLIGEIQGKILASSGGITYLVDRLVDRGFVERRACPEDRRARYAALTPEGLEFIRSIFPEHARILARAVEGLSAGERRTAIRLLKELGLGAADTPTPEEPDDDE